MRETFKERREASPQLEPTCTAPWPHRSILGRPRASRALGDISTLFHHLPPQAAKCAPALQEWLMTLRAIPNSRSETIDRWKDEGEGRQGVVRRHSSLWTRDRLH